MKTINLSDVAVGDMVILRDTDSNEEAVAALRKGGKAGGLAHDLYMAYVCEVEDADAYPTVVAGQADADKLGISL